jgi:Fic family protein
MFEPRYKVTNKMVSMLTAIAEARSIIGRAKLLPKLELRLRRQALIRMSHSSTGIEGNQLNIRQVEAIVERKKIDAPIRDIYEVQNYLSALRYIGKVVKGKKPITERTILAIHHLVTDKTLSAEQSGHYRRVPVYVVRRRLGMPQEVLYTAPGADEVPKLMKDLVMWLRTSEQEDIHPIIVAGVVHAEIAAIHPFVDGNGRTARALATLILYARGYDFRQLFALEDYYNQERPKYYEAINMGKTYGSRKSADLTRWLEYFVRGFKNEIDDVKTKVIALAKRKIGDDIASQIYLDKDQSAILDFLDQVGRINVQDVMDVLECPKRTAQLHLQKLKKVKMIKQVGKGPSSAYITY